MLTFPKDARINRPMSAACAAAMATAILALASTSVAAHDPMEAGMAETSITMDHSKMGGMKHMEGMSMTGDVDVDFAKNMRMHHQMAVTMAQAQIKNSKDAELIDFSRTIITAQNKEIATLDAWLNANKQRAGNQGTLPR